MVAAVAKTAQEYVFNFASDFSALYVCLLSVSREKSQGTNDLIVHGATSHKHESTAQEVKFIWSVNVHCCYSFYQSKN